MSNQLSKYGKIVAGLQPIDTTGAAANGDYISMKGLHHVSIVLMFGVALVATPAITLTQAKTVAGGSAKALGFDKIQVNAATGTSDAFVDTDVTSNTIDKAAGSGQLFVIEVDASDLDGDNAFDCLRCNLESPGGNATLVSILYVGTPLRYGAQSPPSAITN